MRKVAFFVCFYLAGAVGYGQVRTTGQLSGTVLDPSGAAIPNAQVTVNEPATGFTSSANTSSAGAYSFAELQPGNYQVTATAPGFAQAVYNSVVIEAARTTDL